MTTPGLRELKVNIRGLTRERDIRIQEIRNTYAKEVMALSLKKNERIDELHKEYEEAMLKLRGEWRGGYLARLRGEPIDSLT